MRKKLTFNLKVIGRMHTQAFGTMGIYKRHTSRKVINGGPHFIFPYVQVSRSHFRVGTSQRKKKCRTTDTPSDTPLTSQIQMIFGLQNYL